LREADLELFTIAKEDSEGAEPKANARSRAFRIMNFDVQRSRSCSSHCEPSKAPAGCSQIGKERKKKLVQRHI
jgi:hypothetical protein